MSYYNSKNPGLIAYVTVLALSVGAFLLLPSSNIILGALTILWGILCLMRVLTLFEVNEYFENTKTTSKQVSKHTNNQTTPLAYDLTKRMKGKNYFKHGLAAMECVEPRTLLWFTMAALYAVSSFYFNDQINIEDISLLFMIGAVFWLGQSYGFSRSATYVISSISLTATLYALASLSPVITTNILQAAIEQVITKPSVIMLIALVAYSIGVLIHALVENPRQSGVSLLGLLLLVTLTILYFALPPNHENIALWLPLWSLFSLTWIRAYKAPKTRYTLYPC